uniref:Perlucin-like n=1 Tax=Crassostrea virginica TaxID=6565 RepID=A0A8B8ASQ5_CRAVI|nr:perlucin-like [Crassostrea virginica]
MVKIVLCGLLVLGLLLGITLTQPAAGVSCPPNWSHHAQSCYLFVTGLKAEWIKAVSFCRELNAQIVAIETENENKFLRNYLSHNHTHETFWIGGTDAFSEGHWVWVTTLEPFEYVDWAPQEPNQGAQCQCMTLAPREAFHWNDDICHNQYDFICEKEAELSMTGEIIG